MSHKLLTHLIIGNKARRRGYLNESHTVKYIGRSDSEWFENSRCTVEISCENTLRYLICVYIFAPLHIPCVLVYTVEYSIATGRCVYVCVTYSLYRMGKSNQNNV